MSLKERAKADIERITSNTNEWAQAMTLIAPSGGPELDIQAIFTSHTLGVDAQLQKWSNVPNAHFSVSEKQLIDGQYPYLNSGGVVHLEHHKVRVTDSSGTEYVYRINQWFPNRTIGLITCLLGEYKDDTVDA